MPLIKVYHTTLTRYLKSILKRGLRAHKAFIYDLDKFTDPRIYVSTNLDFSSKNIVDDLVSEQDPSELDTKGLDFSIISFLVPSEALVRDHDWYLHSDPSNPPPAFYLEGISFIEPSKIIVEVPVIHYKGRLE